MKGKGRRTGGLALLLAAVPWSTLGEAQSGLLAQTGRTGTFEVHSSMSAEKLAPLEVTFGATAAPGESVEWDFGDGSVGRGPQVTHTYYRPGLYTVRTTLRDGRGQVRSVATGRVEALSAGPERAGLVVLLGRGEVRLSAAGSVVYRPLRPSFRLNGQAVNTGPLAVAAGEYQANLSLPGQQKVLERRVNFRVAPLTASVPFETEVLRLTNRARARGWNCATLREGGPARPPLTRDPRLEVAALAQSAGMALGGYFDHQSAVDGSTPAQRVEAAGLSAGSSAENIAAGQPTPEEVVQAWLRSPGHCRNIMGDFARIGVAYAGRPYSKYTHYWTQVFATPAP